MPTIYLGGGEDSEFFQVGGGTVTTNTFFFRSLYARCALLCIGTTYWQNWESFNLSTFWNSVRAGMSSWGVNNINAIAYADSSNIERLRIRGVSQNVFKVEKVDASGTATQLGSNFTMICSNTSGAPDKVDVFVNYNVSGTFTVYFNTFQVFTFSGDVTTNSVTALAYGRFGPWTSGTNGSASEIIFADSDTRAWSLQTLAPVANGNTHNWDTGSPAAANVNEITLNDTTIDGSTTAAQIDQYTIPALVSGSIGILAVGVSTRALAGASGPSKLDLNVRVGGSDYFSSDQVLTTVWGNYQNWWSTDPNTAGLAWAALPTNIGLKSVT